MMKKLEFYVFPVTFIIGFLIYLLEYPFGAIITIFSLLGLSCLYFYFGFALFNKIPFRRIFKKESYQSISIWRIIGAIVTGFSISIVIVGVLFKIFRWPFANQLLIIGSFFLIITFIVSLIKHIKHKNASAFYKSVVLRVVFFGVGGILFLCLPDYTFLALKYKNHPDYIEAVKQLDKDPENIELIKEEQRAYEKMIRE